MERQVPLCCPGHSRPVVFLEYTDITPDGYFFVSACKDGKPMIRDGVTGDWIGTFLGHKGAVWGVAIDRQGLKVATASADFSAKIWDAIEGTELFDLEHPHIVRTVAFSKDATHLLTGCNDKQMRVYDMQKIATGPVCLPGHTSSIKAAIFGPQDNIVFSSSEEHSVKVWDLRSSSIVKELPTAQPVTSIELSRDGTTLTTASGSSVHIWNAATYELLHSADIGVPTGSASLHPNKHRFVAGCQDNWVRVHDNVAGEIGVLKGHFGPVHCIRYAPDGNTFASGSEDGTIRIWQSDPRPRPDIDPETALTE
eukprot:c7970_g1_i1.p1 GENE.c7970_g1_i1~~c7970_g1_i1.p1  ORF type:complete len:310 (-),score=66.65 c7970_g1_i1:85-1014(-)